MKRDLWIQASAAVLAASIGAVAAPARADEARTAASPATVEQVVVTARKRQESDIAVPVSVTAMSAQQVERQAILNVADVASHLPALSVNNNTSGGGGSTFLRGIGTSAVISSTLEQSVSLSLDGAPTSRGNALRLGQYDVEQIQILKGPQALFFGKDSPAGVIAFKSKDPTSEFESIGKASYEPYANNRFGELTISGPITNSLRARVFVHAGGADGEKDNLSSLALPTNVVLPGAVTPNPATHAWAYSEKFLRGTLIYQPNDRFTARLTAAYEMLDGAGTSAFRERYYCPLGKAQTTTLAVLLGAGPNTPAVANALAVDDCKLNQTIFSGGNSPASLISPQTITHDPAGASLSRVSVDTAELTYRLSDHIDLTSLSALLRISDRGVDNFTWAPASPPSFVFYNRVLQSQFSEELRATSHFDGPVNVMVGGFYEDATFETFAASTGAPPFNVFQFHIPNRVYSGFGQIIWDIVPTLELAAGARYTSETKSLLLTRDGVPQPTANPKVTFDNTSPEVTLTWRPNGALTLYGAYKTGFKSGGYAATISGNGPPLTTNPLQDFLYDPEKSEGFEGGVKSMLLDRTLRLDAVVYSYEYSNLQVSNVDASTGVPILRVLNAATARQRGVEVEATYYPPQVSGLRLAAFVNYNDSHYVNFISPCWIGQSIAEGCNLRPAASGAFTSQDLAGKRFTNAPLWTGNLSFSYVRPLNGLRLEIGADTSYRSSYNPTTDLSPGGVQQAYALVNAQIRLLGPNDGWEVGLYGKNLSNVQRALDTSSVPLTGTSRNTGTVNGGVPSRADLAASTNPGRAIFIQVVVRPSAWR